MQAHVLQLALALAENGMGVHWVVVKYYKQNLAISQATSTRYC